MGGENLIKAITQNGEVIISLEQNDYPKEKCYCPGCGEEVSPKFKGDFKIKHFSHKADSDCSYGVGESEQHIMMKFNMYKILKAKYPKLNIELEKRFGDDRRADLFVEGRERNIVFEFQASKTTREEIKARTAFYNNQGCDVIWIFHISRVGHDSVQDINNYHRKSKRSIRVCEEMRYMHNSLNLYVMDDNANLVRVLLKPKANTKETFYAYCQYVSEYKFSFYEVFDSDNAMYKNYKYALIDVEAEEPFYYTPIKYNWKPIKKLDYPPDFYETSHEVVINKAWVTIREDRNNYIMLEMFVREDIPSRFKGTKMMYKIPSFSNGKFDINELSEMGEACGLENGKVYTSIRDLLDDFKDRECKVYTCKGVRENDQQRREYLDILGWEKTDIPTTKVNKNSFF